MPDMYARFSSEALFVMRRARQLIDEVGQRQLFPEQILLAMLELKRCDARKIFDQQGLDLKTLRARLEEGASAWRIEPDLGSGGVRSYMSTAARQVLDEAMLAAARKQVFTISTQQLLVGILHNGSDPAARLLQEFDVTQVAAEQYSAKSIERSGDHPDQILAGNPFRISPIFLALVAATVGSAWINYKNLDSGGFFVFVFVVCGWLVSLALHEFGHAIAAFYAGDRSVAHKGYLTLNPLKYTHPLISILLPMVFIMMGGIGLPGGAVYIDHSAIRDQKMHSLVSAAGPIATFLVALLLAIPFLLFASWESWMMHTQFWAAIALLILFQVTALVLNLLPLPGLDGFNIIAPFMDDRFVYTVRSMSALTFFALFYLFFNDTPVSGGFWQLVLNIIEFLRVEPGLVGEGIDLFYFWR